MEVKEYETESIQSFKIEDITLIYSGEHINFYKKKAKKSLHFEINTGTGQREWDFDSEDRFYRRAFRDFSIKKS